MTQAKLDPQQKLSSRNNVESTLSDPAPFNDADSLAACLTSRLTSKATQSTVGSTQLLHSQGTPVPRTTPAQATISEPSPRKRPNRGMQFAKSLFWGGLFGITTLVSGTIGATLALVLPLSPEQLHRSAAPQVDLPDKPRSIVGLWRSGLGYRVSRPVNILVMGIDLVPEAQADSKKIFAGRSDTMLLVRIDPVSKTLSLLSIPRDTQVDLSAVHLSHLDSQATEVPDYGTMKINQANSLGGPAMAAQVVSKTLNDIPIDRYVRVNTEAFRELVDLLGGLEVFVPAPMKYTDHTQKLYIDLQPGLQTLNGNQAEQFARFRYDGYGDIGRVQRQQALLKALRDRLKNPAVITKLPQVLRVMSKYIDTNLSLEEMVALMNFGLDLEPSGLKMVMLPGRFSTPSEYLASYWLLDEGGRDRVMQQYFSSEPKLASVDPTAVLASQNSFSYLRIAIQNASNQPNVSHKVADALIAKGFTNVYVVEDWPQPQQKTQIIVQRGDQAAANSLSHALGLGEIKLDSTGDIESDLTIRVGNDWVQ